MRRFLLLTAAVGAVLAALRSYRSRRADAELWQEATAPRDLR